MKKKNSKLLLGMTVFLLCFLAGGHTTHAAAVKQLVHNGNKTSTTVYGDMDGNGKKDKINIRLSKANDVFFNGFKVRLNGAAVLTKNSIGSFYDITVNYIYLSKSKEFLQITAYSDSGTRPLNSIYKYNKSSKKFVEVLNLNSGLGAGQDVIKATSTSITVKNSCQPTLTGRVKWNYVYLYKNGKFNLKSSTAKVQSIFQSSNYQKGDGYDSYFAKSKYVANKNLTFYAGTNLKKTSFTVKPGNVVQLTKIKISGQTIYFQFKKGTRTGWSSSIIPDGFKGVNARMAGGFFG